MKQRDIVRKHRVSPIMVSYLVRGMRHTTNKDIAVDVAKITGKAPIEHISPKMRDLYLRLYPELAKLGG